MKKTEEVEDHTTKRIRWIARVWGTLIIVFTLFMFIGYAWNWVTTGKADPLAVENYSALENLPPLFVLLSVLGLGIAWRWEELGGAITIVFSLANLLMLLIHWPITHHFPQYFVAPYGIWMIITISGMLFLICWWRSKKRLL